MLQLPGWVGSLKETNMDMLMVPTKKAEEVEAISQERKIMSCKCKAKGCQKNCDCGEEYCEWHLIELDHDDITDYDLKEDL